MMSETRSVNLPIRIRAESLLADPDTCKFTVSQCVHAGAPFFFASKEQAAGSPLVEALFALPGVDHVLVAENVVTVGKVPDASWPELKTAIGMAIRTQLITGVPAILETPPGTVTGSRTDAEVHTVIQELLDREVNPSIASHGGKISIAEVRDGTLYITMSGGCQGCASSQVTLRQGFEIMLHRVAPEITDIVDVTDHAAGKNPYY